MFGEAGAEKLVVVGAGRSPQTRAGDLLVLTAVEFAHLQIGAAVIVVGRCEEALPGEATDGCRRRPVVPELTQVVDEVLGADQPRGPLGRRGSIPSAVADFVDHQEHGPRIANCQLRVLLARQSRRRHDLGRMARLNGVAMREIHRAIDAVGVAAFEDGAGPFFRAPLGAVTQIAT